jgi:hypothetical protein
LPAFVLFYDITLLATRLGTTQIFKAKIFHTNLVTKFENNTNEAGYISIDKQLKPLLMKLYEKLSKCNKIEECPVGYRSEFSLIPTLIIVGNVSNSTGILIHNRLQMKSVKNDLQASPLQLL